MPRVEKKKMPPFWGWGGMCVFQQITKNGLREALLGLTAESKSLISVLFQYPSISSVSSVAQSSLTLRPYGLQHARLPCPSPTPGAYTNSCPLSQWCHPTISFYSCLQSFPASGSFPIGRLFLSGGQVLEFQFQHQSFQWMFRTDFL